MTADLTRPRAQSPYDHLPALPTFALASEDVAGGERLESDERGQLGQVPRQRRDQLLLDRHRGLGRHDRRRPVVLGADVGL